MLRQLLTLLALISGLGLAATPATAAHANVVSVAATSDTAECPTITTQPLQHSLGLMKAERTQQPCKPKPVIIWTPTVQLQVDRARE